MKEVFEMNDKMFYSLTLNQLQEYIVKLESENERLAKELNSSSKMNTILESIVKSTQTGYSLLRSIEINKNCECNERLNTELRKALNQSISETNLLMNHLRQFLSRNDSDNSDHDSDRGDITEKCDESSVQDAMRQSNGETEYSTSSSSLNSSGDNITASTPKRPTFDRLPDIGFKRDLFIGNTMTG